MDDIFKLNRAGLRRALADAVAETVACLTPTSTADDLARLLAFAQGAGILECPTGLKVTSHPFAVDQAGIAVVAVQATEYPAARVIAATESLSELAGRGTRGRAARLERTIQVVGSVAEMANAAVPALRTLEAYCRGLSRSSAAAPGTVVSMLVIATATDPPELRRYARERYAACWFDLDWQPSDLSEAAVEALIISNENPSPADIGLEIVEFQAGMALPSGDDRGRQEAGADAEARSVTRKGTK
jgi:hypothetical protein